MDVWQDFIRLEHSSDAHFQMASDVRNLKSMSRGGRERKEIKIVRSFIGSDWIFLFPLIFFTIALYVRFKLIRPIFDFMTICTCLSPPLYSCSFFLSSSQLPPCSSSYTRSSGVPSLLFSETSLSLYLLMRLPVSFLARLSAIVYSQTSRTSSLTTTATDKTNTLYSVSKGTFPFCQQ